MIKPILKSPLLFKKAEPATNTDLSVAVDLVDTLRANAAACVGMAANMIGVNKRIIAIAIGPVVIPMINPVITKRSGGTYTAEEGCLSLDGVRTTERYRTIEVEYLDMEWKKCKQTFEGFPAQIIQHEVDHCDGILI